MVTVNPNEEAKSGVRKRLKESPNDKTKKDEANGFSSSSVKKDEDPIKPRAELRENKKENGKEFGKVSFTFDILAICLFLVACWTRFKDLDFPPNIVFDELHYGKYASLYLRRLFFFDPHPPLGKQLAAASASLFSSSYNGTFRFDRIGSPYPDWVPVFGMRFVPALTGSILPPLVYLICKEVGLKSTYAVIAGSLIIFDNALLVQSRHILMEMPLIAFGILSLFFAVKATKSRFSFSNSILIALSALFGTMSMCVKYVGVFYLLLSFFIIFWHLWSTVVTKKELRNREVLSVLGRAYFSYIFTFLAAYVFVFYVHLSILTNAGPHDSVMTSAFQASLKGGLASIIKGQPLQIVHGSQVTLRHSLGRPCWLHSHLHKYPIKYSDGRGSSHQQQVTCYSFKDVNNWWIIKRPNVDNLSVNETRDVIKDGDEINLVHGLSGRLLNSHDVAAPVTPQSQEVSCYIDHKVSMEPEALWRVVISGCGEANCEWTAVKSHVRLIHVSSGQALKMSGRQLPAWGFHQHEVVTDRVLNQDDTIWNVEEHRYTKSEKEKEREIMEAEMIPTEPTVLSFWAKFWELHTKMLAESPSVSESHTYASSPFEWLFLSRGIAYWVAPNSNAQIHFVGNPVIWLTASVGLLLHVGLLIFYAVRLRRNIFDVPKAMSAEFFFQSGVFLGGYLTTYVYHFCVDRTLFLHHYLPSYVFKILLFVATLNHLNSVLPRRGKQLGILLEYIWLVAVFYVFILISPVSYGNQGLSPEELDSMRLIPSWDFIVQVQTNTKYVEVEE